MVKFTKDNFFLLYPDNRNDFTYKIKGSVFSNKDSHSSIVVRPDGSVHQGKLHLAVTQNNVTYKEGDKVQVSAEGVIKEFTDETSTDPSCRGACLTWRNITNACQYYYKSEKCPVRFAFYAICSLSEYRVTRRCSI